MPDDDLDPELKRRFPKLLPGRYRITSPKDRRYNCFAFAANDTQHVWLYTGPGYLSGGPKEVKGDSLDDLTRVYGLLGLQVCDTPELEPGMVKIAIYLDRDAMPSHVARQTRRGTWKSKLGKAQDIEHDTLALLEGDAPNDYGCVVRLMQKTRYEHEDIDD